MSLDCVVDASVGIKLFLEEPLADRADALFSALTDTPPARLYVPDLFYVECTNILWKYVCRFGYAADNARRDVADLRSLALLTVSTSDLLESALELALAYDIIAYDACYAALARQLDLPLVTADTSLARKLDGSDVHVQTLQQL